nr:immunoglobulin heavy chain junction region [Mus musculus]
CARSDGSSYDW